MINEYIQAAMGKAVYEILEEDNSYYGEIPECKGVWANEETLEDCRQVLATGLEDWLLVGIALHHPLPIIDGIDLNVKIAEEVAAT